MFSIAVRLFIHQWFRRTAPLASATLFLLLAFQTISFATPLASSGHETAPPAVKTAGIPGCEEGDTDCGRFGAGKSDLLAGDMIFTAATSSRTRAEASPAAETSAGEPPAHTTVGEKRIPDWNGVWRDTGVLFGSQIVATGFIYVMPVSISSWSSDQKKNSFAKYAHNFVSPVMDNDKAYINYLLHPYWGASYYTRARERGLEKGASFAYSAMISTLFEFGVECFYERPSIQDLIVTPVVGSLIGAFIFEPVRDSIRRKAELHWYDHVALIATDPVGVLSLGFEKLLGIKPTIMIEYSVPKLQKSSTGSPTAVNDTRVGVVWQFPLD